MDKPALLPPEESENRTSEYSEPTHPSASLRSEMMLFPRNADSFGQDTQGVPRKSEGGDWLRSGTSGWQGPHAAPASYPGSESR